MWGSKILWIALLLLGVTIKECYGVETFTPQSFDDSNFMCNTFPEWCNNALDDLGCEEEVVSTFALGSPGRVVNACDQNNTIWTFQGLCECNLQADGSIPQYNKLGGASNQIGTRITQQLLSNRIGVDMSWLLEPYVTGPPYDPQQSYHDVCKIILDRIDCPEAYRTITASDTASSGDFACNCGNFKGETSKHVMRLMLDKMNDYLLKSTPVFVDPVYLSVPMSICITLICGKIGAIIAVYLKLPPIIGFLLAGVGIQNFMSPMYLKGAGFPYPSPASEIKLIALTIVLMRAGLAIKFDEIMATGPVTAVFCCIPYFCEFFLWMYAGQTFFGWPIIDMGLFASIMAPLGPSVVISTLLQFVAGKKDHGYVPKQILISTPIEAVIAIVLFGIFANLEQSSKDTMYPWVQTLPLWENCVLIPANLLFSTVMGIVLGWLNSRYIDWRSQQKTDYIWVRVNKNPQMGSSTADLVFVLLVTCYTMMSLCTRQYIQQSSGVLVVFVTCITVSKLANPEISVSIAQGLKGIWIFAEVFLFTLTGCSLSFDSSNGPLYGQRGPSPDMVKTLIGMMFIGMAGRLFGFIVCVLCTYKTLPKHRQNFKWLSIFVVNSWIYAMPKATVQATMGGIAYTQHLIPGAVGMNEAMIIAQSTAFTVLIFAPLGSLLTYFVGSPMSMMLAQMDKDSNWSNEKMRYLDDNEDSQTYDGETDNKSDFTEKAEIVIADDEFYVKDDEPFRSDPTRKASDQSNPPSQRRMSTERTVSFGADTYTGKERSDSKEYRNRRPSSYRSIPAEDELVDPPTIFDHISRARAMTTDLTEHYEVVRRFSMSRRSSNISTVDDGEEKGSMSFFKRRASNASSRDSNEPAPSATDEPLEDTSLNVGTVNVEMTSTTTTSS